MSTDPRVAEAMKLAERFAVSTKDLDTQLGANRAALREYLAEQFSVPFSVVDFTRKVAEQHAAEIARLTAELADEKAVNEHQRSELQDRLQKQRAVEAKLQAETTRSMNRSLMYVELADAMGYDIARDGLDCSPEEWAKALLIDALKWRAGAAELEEARKDAGPIAEVVDNAHYHDQWRLQIHGITVAGDIGADARRTFQRLAGQINMAAAMTKETPHGRPE